MASFGGNLAAVEDPEERRIVEPGQMYTPEYLFEQGSPLSEEAIEEPGLLGSIETESFRQLERFPATPFSENVEEEVSCFLPQLHQVPFDDINDREFTLGMGPMIGSGLDDITDGITANLEGLLEDISYMVPVSATNAQSLTPADHAVSRPTTQIIRPSQMRPLSSQNAISVSHIPTSIPIAHAISHPVTPTIHPTQMQPLSSQNTVPDINVIPPILPGMPTPDMSTIMRNLLPNLMHRLSSNAMAHTPIRTIKKLEKRRPRPTVEKADNEEEWQAPIAPMDRPFTPETTPHPIEVPFAKEAAPPPESPPRHEGPEPASPPTPPPTLRRSTRKRAAPKRFVDE